MILESYIILYSVPEGISSWEPKKGALESEEREVTCGLQLTCQPAVGFFKNGVKMNLRMPLEIIPPSENIREFPVGL